MSVQDENFSFPRESLSPPRPKTKRTQRRKSNLFHHTQKLHALAAKSKSNLVQSIVAKVRSTSPGRSSICSVDCRSFSDIDTCTQTDDCLDIPSDEKPEFKWIEGRRFHDIAGFEYPLPNDSKEEERLHLQHRILTHAFQGLFSAPIDDLLTKGANVLDIGCGPGSWALDMARSYPNSSVIGIDIAEQFPPDEENVNFIVANAAERLPFSDASFDYIHQRLLSLSLTLEKWDNVMSEIYRVLKPGGYVELTELDYDFQRWGPYGRKGMEVLHNHVRSRSIDPNTARRLPALLIKANLVPKHTSYISMPLGRWGGKLGVLFANDILEAVQAIGPMIAREHGGMRSQDFEALYEALLPEWEEGMSFANYFKCWGRKEEDI